MDDIEDGYPMVELDSDADEVASSSEDEIDVILHGTPKQKRALRRRSLGQKSSSEDEFEKEMEAELNQRMNHIASQQAGIAPERVSSSKDTSDKNVTKSKKSVAEEFDDAYCSDEDENQEQDSTHVGPSNDELLYDPDLDDVDQHWVDRQRERYQVQGTGGQAKRKAPATDAVLCCPACMLVLCRDCQRHSLYKNQFRAMFVTNCSVDTTEILRFPVSQKQTKKNKKGRKAAQQTVNDGGETSMVMPEDCSENEKYHPVHCITCNTQVAMYDSDEIYHFFNVIEGNG